MSEKTNELTIDLKKPIEAHGSQIKSLTLREPTAGDVMDLGHPFYMEQAVTGESKIVADFRTVGRYISLLAGIPESSVRAMHASDLKKAGDWLGNFLGE